MARQIIGGGFSDLLDLGSINMAQSVRNATLPAGQVILFVILSIRILLFLISPQTKPSCNKLQTSLAVKDNFEALGCPLKTIGRDIFRGSWERFPGLVFWACHCSDRGREVSGMLAEAWKLENWVMRHHYSRTEVIVTNRDFISSDYGQKILPVLKTGEILQTQQQQQKMSGTHL